MKVENTPIVNDRNENENDVHKSVLVNIISGVRQGGVLFPQIFKVYIGNVIIDIINFGIGCKLGFFYNLYHIFKRFW